MGDLGPDLGDQDDMEAMEPDNDQLPFGLSHQLGQLILGAAQNFNADNPQFDMNFFAPVLGGDDNFGFNPGLLDSSDSDSFADEEESSQIFISLADSHNIRRLSFHKNVDSVHKFPRLSPDEWPCYEELYRLLEEVELLGKVWRRRQEHPYTAHIVPVGDQALREGEDYYSSDYEYDSDEEEDFDQLPPGGVNETLTKKKYCQSYKLFQQIFDSSKQFEAFQRSISKMKKHVFGIIFALFLEALPTATRYKIPQELWEKVWKFTQNAYFRYKDSVPLHKDTSYYRAGLRSVDPRTAAIEKERLRELFGAVGNLHMIMFEILFKNPSILQPNPLFELECGDGAQEKMGRGVFRAAIQAARTKFSRLQQMELILNEGTDNVTPNPTMQDPTAMDLDQKMNLGIYVIKDVCLKLRPLPLSVTKLDPPSSVIVSQSTCSKIVLTGRYVITEGGEEFGLLLVVVSAVTGAVLEVIRTGHSYQSHLIEVGACAVKRKGGAGWKNHFYLTEDRISFLARTVDSSSDTVRIWSFPLTIQTTRPLADPPVIAGSTPLVQTVGRPIQSNPTLRHSAVASLGHTNRILLLLSQSPFSLGPMSTLSLFSLDCGELTMEIPWPGQDLGLSGLTNTRALLHTEASIHFFSLTAGETVQTFTHQQLATEFRLPEVERWSGVMECNPEVRQFVLHTPSLSAYRILQYEEKEMAIPTIVLQGSNLAEAMEGMGASVRLVSGCLVTNKSRELATSFPGSMGGMEEGRVACHEIAAYSLASGVRHSLLAMGADREAAAKAELLLNHLSVRWWDDRNQRCLAQKTLWNPERRPVFVISPSLVGVLLESGTEIRLVDFTPSIQEVARQEGDWLLKQEMEEKKEGSSVRMEE